MNRVLVTGARGFIGRHCLPRLLEQGYDVHAVSSKPVVDMNGAVQWHQADLLDCEQTTSLVQLTRPTHLLHLAWELTPGKLYHSCENMRWVSASLHLVNTFRNVEGARAVVAGTCYEYDHRGGVCSETTTPTQPATYYGVCKNALQQLLAGYADQSQLSIAWARLFFLYGPGERRERLVPSVISALQGDQPARCSHGEQLRDYMYVGDTAAALVRLLESDVSGPINIGTGRAVALKQIMETIGDKLGRRDLIQLGAVAARPGEEPLIVADTQRMSSQLNWSPRTSLEAGLDATIAWWIQQLETV